MRRGHKLPSGAEIADGGVRFRLWAPRARSVELWLDEAAGGGDGSIIEVAMAPAPGGWWSLTAAKAGPGTRYRYAVDGSPFPDPASRAQLAARSAAFYLVPPGAAA